MSGIALKDLNQAVQHKMNTQDHARLDSGVVHGA